MIPIFANTPGYAKKRGRKMQSDLFKSFGVTAFSDPILVAALEPIPRVDLTEEVVRRFKWLLAEGKLKPGGRLPPERELATLLGISRPSLRHGLKALELLGAIESRRRHGTFVSDSAGKVLEEPLAFLVLLNATTFEELYEVRRTVEVELAALASTRATRVRTGRHRGVSRPAASQYRVVRPIPEERS